MLLAKIILLSLFPESKCWLGNSLLVKMTLICKLWVIVLSAMLSRHCAFQMWLI